MAGMSDKPTPPMRAAIVPVTPLQQNCSLIWCTKTMKGALVDPGGDLDRLKAAVEKAGVTLEKLLVTHGHLDHCGQTGILAKELGLPVEGPHGPPGEDGESRGSRQQEEGHQEDREEDEALSFPIRGEASPHARMPPSLP